MRPRPIVMGIVNVTPDSFSDGGLHGDGVRHAERLIEEGADWIDVGGESTRPGAPAVDAETEWDRVQPVIAAFANDIPVSIDTSKASVAIKALRAGARIINDVSGFSDEAMPAVTADAERTIVMHMRGTPQTMQSLTHYENLVQSVCDWLTERAALAKSAEVWIDPGIGFAKTAEQSIHLLGATGKIASMGLPVLIGASRKSFIDKAVGAPNPHQRLGGSLAAVASTWSDGAQAFRVHDVRETRQLLDLLYAIEVAAQNRR